jgi:hypothetical protein
MTGFGAGIPVRGGLKNKMLELWDAGRLSQAGDDIPICLEWIA